MTPEQLPLSGLMSPDVAKSLPPFIRTSETSREAAISMYGEPSSNQRARILDYLQGNGPASCETICHMLHMSGDSVRPRLVELRKQNLVCEVGEGLTSKNRRCVTYGAVQ